MTISLRDLLSACEPGAYVHGDELVQVSGVASDSRKVQAGDLFAAIAGGSHDASTFAASAIARGARAIIADKALSIAAPTLVVKDVRAVLGPVAHRVYGDPTGALRTAGITGTNGKTTVSYLLESVLERAGLVPALLGTVALRGPAGEQVAELTTPEADAIARFARIQLDAGARSLVMEVSSHALEQGRVSGMQFDVAAFTNLSQDHLDFHGTMEAYGSAKAKLFFEHAPKVSVITTDGSFGLALATRLTESGQRVVRCNGRGGDPSADFAVRSFTSDRSGIRADVRTPAGDLMLESPLFGAHNLENLLVVLGVAHALQLDVRQAAFALKTAQGAPGRMERVAHPNDVLVLVDYAHTPDAIERGLQAVRSLTKGRVFVVCGCGGDRDRKKRDPMAEAAARGADVTILTSDNPRTEDPVEILEQMEPGALRVRSRVDAQSLASVESGYTVVVSRSEAIQRAIEAARPGDSVLLAGKGHETYQIVGATKYPFDDRVEAALVIAAQERI